MIVADTDSDSKFDQGAPAREPRTGSWLVIAVCNNVGEAAFLGRNQKFENALPQAS